MMSKDEHPGKTVNRRQFTKYAVLAPAVAGAVANLTRVARAAEEITLSFPNWQAEEPGFGDWWRELIAQFESENPGVKIEMEQIPAQEFTREMLVRYSSGQFPDIAILRTLEFGSFAAQDWFEPLDARFAESPLPDDWTTLQAELNWGGKPLGIVIMGYGFVLFYNDKILKAANVAPPTSIAEFSGIVSKITDPSNGLYGLASSTSERSSIYQEMISYVRWQGADLITDRKYTLTADSSVVALESYRKIVGETHRSAMTK
jgi:multiple sugar transport system substrate-binding protein